MPAQARAPRLEAQRIAAIDACAATQPMHRHRHSIVVAYDIFERVLPLDAARDVRTGSESIAEDARLSIAGSAAFGSRTVRPGPDRLDVAQGWVELGDQLFASVRSGPHCAYRRRCLSSNRRGTGLGVGKLTIRTNFRRRSWRDRRAERAASLLTRIL